MHDSRTRGTREPGHGPGTGAGPGTGPDAPGAPPAPGAHTPDGTRAARAAALVTQRGAQARNEHADLPALRAQRAEDDPGPVAQRMDAHDGTPEAEPDAPGAPPAHGAHTPDGTRAAPGGRGPGRPSAPPVPRGRPAAAREAAGRAVRAAVAAARRPYWQRPDPSWLVRRWPDLTATCVATAFFWLSLTPSLVPRPWLLQGVIGGITAAIGYGLGALARWVVRGALGPACRRYVRPRLGRPGARWRARAWQAYHVLALGLTVLALSESARMQRELRTLQGLPETLTWHSLMISVIALALCALLVALARTVRLCTRGLIRVLGRFAPRPVAVVAGLLISAAAVVFGTRDVVFDRGVVDVVSRLAESTNSGTRPGVVPPASRLVSGGPHSLVRWRDLGYEGRNFAGSTPTARRIARVTGRPAKDPVRVYVGEQSADGFAARARLAVRELERTGGFDREVLAVAGTTGRGWVNSTDAEPLEFLHGGDTAIVATQYSYLPSWLSFVVDKEQAGRANRALVRAVRAHWLTLPPGHRPRLVVFGESLGAYGIEAAFDGPADLLAKVDGAVLAGSPNFSPVRREVTARRDRGSPVWRPAYDRGRHFRFAQFPRRDLARPAGPWRQPRVAYLQNASDPIVWWSWDLALRRPPWLRGPLGPDITDGVHWFPFVTFWQTTVDMAVSYGVDAPHGHRYGTAALEAWLAVAPPHGWSAADVQHLRAYMDARKAPY